MFSYFREKREERTRQRAWPAEQERLSLLKQELLALGGFPQVEDAFNYAVRFFQIVSDFQDAGSICNAPAELSEAQCSLNSHIRNAGRNTCGYNRTGRGEAVSLKNTYWGNIFGLFTLSGEEWSTSASTYVGFAKQWLKDPSQYEVNPESRKVIVDFQLKPFVQSHLSNMLDLCDKLLAA